MKNSSLLLNVCAESIHYVLSGLPHHVENISVFNGKKIKNWLQNAEGVAVMREIIENHIKMLL